MTLQLMSFEPRTDAPTVPLSPKSEPTTQPEIVDWVPILESEIEIDPDAIVEEAELLLREGAPHDFDVLIIGGGPGGVAAALGASRGGLQVALVEKEGLGGAYLGGCLASKMLLQMAKESASPDWAAMQSRNREVAARLRAQTQQELETAGVEILPGNARFVEEHSLEIENGAEVRRVLAVHVVIAVGGRAEAPDVPGATSPGVVTPNQILGQETVPSRVVVMGAGTVGTEIAWLLAALGAQVSLLDSQAVLPGEDEEIQAAVLEHLHSAGIAVQIGAEVTRIETQTAGLR
ncbi:MAG TPA: FAD-dependent oxidoreductase, partial [Abditibacterium sp.]